MSEENMTPELTLTPDLGASAAAAAVPAAPATAPAAPAKSE